MRLVVGLVAALGAWAIVYLATYSINLPVGAGLSTLVGILAGWYVMDRQRNSV